MAGILYLVFQFIPQVTSAPDWFVEHVMPTLGVFSGLSTLPFIGTTLQIAILVLITLSSWQVVVFANWLYNKIRGSG